MDKQLWTAVDEYTTGLLMPPDPVLEATLAASDAAGLPTISVSPSQGKLLMLLAQLAGARGSWRSARWAGTAASGWPVRSSRVDA